MRRIIHLLFFVCAVCTGIFAQSNTRYYVSASGNTDNTGTSEDSPFSNMNIAIIMAWLSTENVTITVIGTIDMYDQGFTPGNDIVFNLMDPIGSRQILITGKPNATGEQRAVLSARGANAIAVAARGSSTNIRFEHIDIIGGAGEYPLGIGVLDGAQVTLGSGAVVRNNVIGVGITEGRLIIDGGEIRNNTRGGVIVGEKGIVTMRQGTISNNTTPYNGGGVGINGGGRFTMSGGTITNNRAGMAGGGVFVLANGRFDQTGGTISNNTAQQGSNRNIYRAQGALGSNLTPGTSSNQASASSPPPSSSSPPASSPSGFSWHIPLFFGVSLNGLNLNTASLTFPLQLGVEFDFGRIFRVSLLGEAALGIGWPYIVEYNYGFMSEFYFSTRKTFGLGWGMGVRNTHLHFAPLTTSDYDLAANDIEESLRSLYTRIAVVFRGNSKLSLYAEIYHDIPTNNMFESLGVGLIWNRDFFK